MGDFDVNATAGGNIFKVNNKTTTNVGLNQQMNEIQNIMNYQEQNTRESMYKKQISSPLCQREPRLQAYLLSGGNHPWR